MSSSRKDWDLTSTNSLQGAAEWLRKKAGPEALAVIVIRVNDLAVAADPLVSPGSTVDLIDDRRDEVRGLLTELRTAALAKLARKRLREAVHGKAGR